MKRAKTKPHQKKTEAKAKQDSQGLSAQSGEVEKAPTSAPTLRDNVADLLKDQPIFVNSIAAGLLGLDQGSILRELQQARKMMLRFYMGDNGGNHSAEDAVKLVRGPGDEEGIERDLRRVFSESVDQVSWYELERIYNHFPTITRKVWQLVLTEASKELESGNRMAATLETTDWQREAWKRAQFLAIRNGFVTDWKPNGAIERALIDMMAQEFSEYLYWSEQVHHRSTTDMKILYSREEERRIEEAEGNWVPPRVSEKDAIEHAMQMMDRYNRLFVRTLRQLRDLRRYSTPVTINNPAQVNFAADGGQQVNAVKVEAQVNG